VALVEREDVAVALRTQADLLSISRSSLYYQPRQPSAEEVALKHRIDALYTQYPFYGSRRITAQLRREGRGVNRKAVQRHMRDMGIAGICPGPNLSRRAHGAQVYPYLLRTVASGYPNHVWGIDVTYIRLRTSWMYLVAVLDWFSRYVISWELDDTLQLPFVLSAVQRALAQARPVIWNSDQGSHFTSPQYRDLLVAADVQISMDGKGRALDNIFVERACRAIWPSTTTSDCIRRSAIERQPRSISSPRLAGTASFRSLSREGGRPCLKSASSSPSSSPTRPGPLRWARRSIPRTCARSWPAITPMRGG
jgi:putative transposase